MKANLFLNFYRDKQPTRQKELVACLIKNYYNRQIDRLIIIVAESDKEYLKQVFKDNAIDKTPKAFIVVQNNRPSYNYYFRLSREYPHDINILANTDIVMCEDSIRRLKGWNWKRHCLALSRWDYLTDDMSKHACKHHANRDSQDTWMVKGGFPDIRDADFGLGFKGCDNRIAYLLSQYFIMLNPSQSIRTFHYHLTEIRNYAPHGTDKDLIPPPYKMLPVSKLPI